MATQPRQLHYSNNLSKKKKKKKKNNRKVRHCRQVFELQKYGGFIGVCARRSYRRPSIQSPEKQGWSVVLNPGRIKVDFSEKPGLERKKNNYLFNAF